MAIEPPGSFSDEEIEIANSIGTPRQGQWKAVREAAISEERKRCADIADRQILYLKRMEQKRRAKGDEIGARRSSSGRTVAARIKNEIKTGVPI